MPDAFGHRYLVAAHAFLSLDALLRAGAGAWQFVLSAVA